VQAPIHACMHTYIHPCMHAYIDRYIHAYIHTYIHTKSKLKFLLQNLKPPGRYRIVLVCHFVQAFDLSPWGPSNLTRFVGAGLKYCQFRGPSWGKLGLMLGHVDPRLGSVGTVASL